MDVERARAGREEPFAWWGPLRRPPERRSVLDLVRAGVLDPGLAGLLWAALARRRSLTVVAGPSGAGKTTLLTALLDLLPAGERRVYVRGCYEPFDFLADPAVVPERTVLLVNEISPHLPTYLWGPGVRRLLAAARAGFAVGATAHAGSAEELVGALAGYPLRLPPAEIAALGLVLALDAWEEDGRIRRVARELAALQATPAGGIVAATLARRDRHEAESALDLRASAAVLAADVGRGGATGALAAEVERRAAILLGLAGGERLAPDAVAGTLARASARARLAPAPGADRSPSGQRSTTSTG